MQNWNLKVHSVESRCDVFMCTMRWVDSIALDESIVTLYVTYYLAPIVIQG